MKLLRVGPAGAERPALLDASGTLRDLSGLVPEIDGALLADDAALARIRQAATAEGAGALPAIEDGGVRIGPPLARIGKIVCIGLNYHDHARETGAEPPAERWGGPSPSRSCGPGTWWSWRSRGSGVSGRSSRTRKRSAGRGGAAAARWLRAGHGWSRPRSGAARCHSPAPPEGVSAHPNREASLFHTSLGRWSLGLPSTIWSATWSAPAAR